MGRKKRNRAEEDKETKPYCTYCDKLFQDDKVLETHQKAKHFKCTACDKKLSTAGGLVVHMYNQHKQTITTIANSKPGRDSISAEILSNIVDEGEYKRQKTEEDIAAQSAVHTFGPPGFLPMGQMGGFPGAPFGGFRGGPMGPMGGPFRGGPMGGPQGVPLLGQPGPQGQMGGPIKQEGQRGGPIGPQMPMNMGPGGPQMGPNGPMHRGGPMGPNGNMGGPMGPNGPMNGQMGPNGLPLVGQMRGGPMGPNGPQMGGPMGPNGHMGGPMGPNGPMNGQFNRGGPMGDPYAQRSGPLFPIFQGQQQEEQQELQPLQSQRAVIENEGNQKFHLIYDEIDISMEEKRARQQNYAFNKNFQR
jgi:hypothetical protein